MGEWSSEDDGLVDVVLLFCLFFHMPFFVYPFLRGACLTPVWLPGT